MVDPQRAVEGVRNLVYSGQQPAPDLVRPAAAEYAEACQEVNRRLARCEEFLRQGLRAEAIQFAQTEPNLLDMLGVLDISERPLWNQWLQACNLPPAPVFQIETAAALNRAYAEAEPLEHLLRQHRLLALSRAPLDERLAVMRQLAQADARNQIWQQDIITFETVRAEHLQKEVDKLQRLPTLPPLEVVSRLLQEVQQWRTTLPLGLVSAVEDMYQRVYTDSLQKRLTAVAQELSVTHKNKDEGRARQMIQEWRQLTQQLVLPPNDKRAIAVALAKSWLERREHKQLEANDYQQAVTDLLRALQRPNISAAELEEIYVEATTFKEGVPAHLDDAYVRRMNRLQSTTERRDRLVLVTVSLVGAIILCGLLYLLLRPR